MIKAKIHKNITIFNFSALYTIVFLLWYREQTKHKKQSDNNILLIFVQNSSACAG